MPFDRPAMMAIGDSLYNGVRSLTIDPVLAHWSVPAQVARALGIADFVVPDYPKNVVVNMEAWLRMLPNLDLIRSDLSANVTFWLTRPKSPSGATYFDNISIASTTWDDMISRKASTADAHIAELEKAGVDQLKTLSGPIADLFFAFNTRYLLDPDGTNAGRTSMDIVRQRKPKRLLVSIGSNNGLWNMCFEATDRGFEPKDTTELSNFMNQLMSLPPEVEHIYLNSLALPRTVSNLMPYPDSGVPVGQRAVYAKPVPGKYFVSYENSMGLLGYARLTGDQVKAMDDRIRNINQRITDIAVPDPRIHIVRMDELLVDYDSKHVASAKTVKIPVGSVEHLTLSNIMTASGDILRRFREGGLQGLDGMHPTIVGYALMAQKVLDAIKAAEGLDPTSPIDITAAERHDTLLTNVPLDWSLIRGVWRDIREAKSRGAAPKMTADGVRASTLMQASRFKTGRSS